MGNRAWNCWVIAPVLAAALWAAGPPNPEENGQPTAFSSAVAFDVYAVIGEGAYQPVGRTPSDTPLMIPPCHWWFVVPVPPVNMEKVRQELQAHWVPGLKLRDAAGCGP